MPKRYRRRNGMNLTPAIAALNILIVIVILALVYAIYVYINYEKIEQSNYNPPQTTRLVTEPVTTAVTTTATTISMTKASTTTPPPVTPENPETLFEPAKTIYSYTSESFKNDLFIGDSITTGFYLFNYLDQTNVFAKIGLNSGTALNETVDNMTLSQKITEMQPENIYIMLGTNGLSYLSNEYMATSMGGLVANISELSPDSVIYVLTIPPVTKAREAGHPQNMSDVNDYNSRLSAIAEEMQVNLIDICSMLKDDTGYMDSRYAEIDGLHFKSDAYQKVLSHIESLKGA